MKINHKIPAVFLLLLFTLLFIACNGDDTEEIVLPSGTVQFVQDNWSENIYRTYEHWLAQNYNQLIGMPESTWPNSGVDTTMGAWEALSWTDQKTYLPPWFTTDFDVTRDVDYYTNIKNYPEQYSVGWQDEWKDPRNYNSQDGFQPANYYFNTEENHFYGSEFQADYEELWEP